MKNFSKNRGDITILYTFMTLIIVIITIFVVARLAVVTMRGTSTVLQAVQAFYAASSGIERAYYDYAWDTSGSGVTCTVLNDEHLCPTERSHHCGRGGSHQGHSRDSERGDRGEQGRGREARYDVTASGDPWGSGSCPSPEEVAGSDRAFCVTAVGKAEGAQRRVESDTNRSLCRQ